ncbi:DNA recombination protein RmuC [Eubacteriales bacterium KG127]
MNNNVIIYIMTFGLVILSLISIVLYLKIRKNSYLSGINKEREAYNLLADEKLKSDIISSLRLELLPELKEEIRQAKYDTEENVNQSIRGYSQLMGDFQDQTFKAQAKAAESQDRRLFELNQRLEQVYKSLGEMKTMARGMDDIKKVLSNVKNRGIMGELQLKAILDEILAPNQYLENVATKPSSTERVEFAIRLPEGVLLPVDSKFPAETYGKLLDAYDTGDKELISVALKNLITIIKKEAKDIRDKYIVPPYTTDFAVMFLPFEGLYGEVVNQGLVDVLQREYKVSIAGPTTFAALLSSLQMGFKTLAIQKRSTEVWHVLATVRNEFEKYTLTLEKTRERLRQADDELNKLVGVRARAINKQLSKVSQFGESEENQGEEF